MSNFQLTVIFAAIKNDRNEQKFIKLFEFMDADYLQKKKKRSLQNLNTPISRYIFDAIIYYLKHKGPNTKLRVENPSVSSDTYKKNICHK
jgi:hypothetical protein